MKNIVYLWIVVVFVTVATLFSSMPTGIVYASTEPSLVPYSAKAYLLVDYNTGTVLEGENATEKHQVASIVKLMTTLLALEAIEKEQLSLDDMITCSPHASSMGGSQAFLDAGQPYKVSELLKSIIIASANDSSVLIGEAIAGSEENFVNLMNQRAKELKMYDTLYVNATGLPDANQYSTALDSAKLLKEVMKHKEYFNYSTIWMDNFYHPLDNRATELANTNRLVRYYTGCDAGKTGYTDEAGYCLVASAKKSDMRLIAVSLGANKSTERFENVSQLLNIGFANYKNAHLAQKGAELAEKLKIRGAKEPFAKLTFEEDFYYITKKGQDENFSLQIELPNVVKAPINKGSYVGKAYVLKNNEVIGEVNIITYDQIAKQNMKDILQKIFYRFGVRKQNI